MDAKPRSTPNAHAPPLPEVSLQGLEKSTRDKRAELLALLDEAKARGVSIRQLEADRHKQPAPLGLNSEFGYDPIGDPGSYTALTWDPDQDRRLARKATRQAASSARRARIAGSPRVEVINRSAIIRRDNSTCYLCGKVCREDEIHLDHVVPLARGGEHIAANLKVACAPCNLSKGARWTTSTQ